MGEALLRLGYSVLGCRLDMVYPLRGGQIRTVLSIAEKFDALQDVPWAALYRELDECYPGSKFILTEREEASWMKSASRHFRDTSIPLHEWLYGRSVLEGNESLYLQRYRKHYRDVMQYFAGRDEDLLILNLEQGCSWEALCKYLGHHVPTEPFPHANKSPERYTSAERIADQIRRAMPYGLRRIVFSARQSVRALLGRPDPRNRFNNFKENRREQQLWRSKQ